MDSSPGTQSVSISSDMGTPTMHMGALRIKDLCKVCPIVLDFDVSESSFLASSFLLESFDVPFLVSLPGTCFDFSSSH